MSTALPPEILPFRVPERGERLLVVAPHPDDETLATGGLLFEATRRGADVRVLFLTSGDGFPLAAMRQFRTRADQRALRRLGEVRREEGRAALAALGVPDDCVAFMGYPDRGLAALWLDDHGPRQPLVSRHTGRNCTPEGCLGEGTPYCGGTLLEGLEAQLNEFRPDVLIGPDPADDHPEHWAGACFLAAAVERVRSRTGSRPEAFGGLVHRGNWPVPMRPGADMPLLPPAALAPAGVRWHSLFLSIDALAAKGAALAAHRTQLPLVGRFLRSFLRANELYSRWEVPRVAGEDGQVVLFDPVRDRFGRNRCAGVDFEFLEIARCRRTMSMTARLRGSPIRWASYRLAWTPVPASAEPFRTRQLLLPGGRGGDPSGLPVEDRRNLTVELTDLPPACSGVVVGAEAWIGKLLLDRTPWRLVRIGPVQT